MALVVKVDRLGPLVQVSCLPYAGRQELLEVLLRADTLLLFIVVAVADLETVRSQLDVDIFRVVKLFLEQLLIRLSARRGAGLSDVQRA